MDALSSHTCTIVGLAAPPHAHVFGLSAEVRFAAVSAPSVPAQQLPHSQPIETRVTRASHGTDLISPHLSEPHGFSQSPDSELLKLIT